MMQDPFSQQDREMEEASPSISFPHVRQLIPVYKVRNVINRGERKNKTGRGQGEVKPSPKTNPKCSSGFHSPSPFPTYCLSFCGCVTCCCCSDSSFCPHLPPLQSVASHFSPPASSLILPSFLLFSVLSQPAIYLFEGYKPPQSMEGGLPMGCLADSDPNCQYWEQGVGGDVVP